VLIRKIKKNRVSLAQRCRFLLLELIQSGLNSRFDMSVAFMINFSFRAMFPETLLVTDFMNLKIKPTQSFRSNHKCKIYVRVFIGVGTHTY
jgi:hypothetical protein